MWAIWPPASAASRRAGRQRNGERVRLRALELEQRLHPHEELGLAPRDDGRVVAAGAEARERDVLRRRAARASGSTLPTTARSASHSRVAAADGPRDSPRSETERRRRITPSPRLAAQRLRLERRPLEHAPTVARREPARRRQKVSLTTHWLPLAASTPRARRRRASGVSRRRRSTASRRRRARDARRRGDLRRSRRTSSADRRGFRSAARPAARGGPRFRRRHAADAALSGVGLSTSVAARRVEHLCDRGRREIVCAVGAGVQRLWRCSAR